jgi:hypothetical protein
MTLALACLAVAALVFGATRLYYWREYKRRKALEERWRRDRPKGPCRFCGAMPPEVER